MNFIPAPNRPPKLFGVAEGDADSIFVNLDGKTWGTVRTPSDKPNGAADRSWTSICTDGPVLVLVGGVTSTGYGAIAYSEDEGATWVSASIPSVSYLTTVSWNGSMFIAGGVRNAILTSSQGRSWTDRSVSFPGGDTTFTSSCSVGGVFILGGSVAFNSGSPNENSIWTTTNGSTFTKRSIPAMYGGYGKSLVVLANEVLADLDSRGFFASSDLGATWTFRSPYIGPINSICHGGANVLVGGVPFVGGVLRSVDQGATWVPYSLSGPGPFPGEGKNFNAVGWGGTQFFAFNDGGEIWTSQDGAAWALTGTTPGGVSSVIALKLFT